jgi:hypothetical protein
LQSSPIGKEFRNQAIVLSPARRSVPFAEVQVSTVDGYDSLPCGLVATMRRNAKGSGFRHGYSLHFTESGSLPDVVESQAALPNVDR